MSTIPDRSGRLTWLIVVLLCWMPPPGWLFCLIASVGAAVGCRARQIRVIRRGVGSLLPLFSFHLMLDLVIAIDI